MPAKIDTRTYPLKDEHGCTWIDPSGFLTPLKEPLDKMKAPCFICSRMTQRIDIDYMGYFCNSYACNLTIERDLKGLSPYVKVDASEDMEPGEVYRRR